MHLPTFIGQRQRSILEDVLDVFEVAIGVKARAGRHQTNVMRAQRHPEQDYYGKRHRSGLRRPLPALHQRPKEWWRDGRQLKPRIQICPGSARVLAGEWSSFQTYR